MYEVPVPSAQVIVPNAHWTFLQGWKPDYRALTHHTVHSQSNSMLLYLGFPHHLVKRNIYVRRSFFKSLKSQVSVASLHLSRHLVPSLLSLGNEVVASGDFPKALLTSRTWAKRSRLLPEPFSWGLKSLREPCWCLRTTLSNVIFTMISAFISRQTSACPLLAYNTKLKSLDEE